MSTMIELDWKLKRKIQKNFSKVSENMLATTSDGNFYTIPTKYRCGDLDDRTDNYVLEIMGTDKDVQVWGGIGEKKSNGGTQWYIQDRIYDSTSMCPLLNTYSKGYWIVFFNKEENTMENYSIRKLTPTECERLQAFPDGWTKYGMNGELISDTQRYKCLGNAVTTTVITAIVNEVFKDYEKH